MRWNKRDKEKGFYVKKFLIFPSLYEDTWYWLETVYLFRRIEYSFTFECDIIIDELVTKQEYMDFKRREAEEREREKNERRAEKERK